MKLWIFSIDALVVSHVSALYNNTAGLNIWAWLNKRTLVDVPISLEFRPSSAYSHECWSCLANPHICVCFPLFGYYIAQIQVKDSTSPSSSLSSMTASLSASVDPQDLCLVLFIELQSYLHWGMMQVRCFVRICPWLRDRSTGSSATSRSSNCGHKGLWISFPFLDSDRSHDPVYSQEEQRG